MQVIVLQRVMLFLSMWFEKSRSSIPFKSHCRELTASMPSNTTRCKFHPHRTFYVLTMQVIVLHRVMLVGMKLESLHFLTQTFYSKTKQKPLPSGSYTVIKCGASGHNVRSRPSLNATPIGMLVLGNRVNVKQCVCNQEGVWLLLDSQTVEKYCFNIDEEAWTLALNRNDVVYLKGEGDNSSGTIGSGLANQGKKSI